MNNVIRLKFVEEEHLLELLCLYERGWKQIRNHPNGLGPWAMYINDADQIAEKEDSVYVYDPPVEEEGKAVLLCPWCPTEVRVNIGEPPLICPGCDNEIQAESWFTRDQRLDLQAYTSS